MEMEEELRETQERFASLLHALDDVVWSASTADYRMLYINDAVEQVYGRPATDFYQDPNLWMEVVHPDDREQVQRSSEALFEQGESNTTYRIVRPDDQVRWLHDRKYLIYDDGGHPVRMGGIASDITERRQAEEALRVQRDLAVALNRTRGLSEALHTVLDGAFQLEEFDSGGVYLVDEQADQVVLAVHENLPDWFVAQVSRFGTDTPQWKLIMKGEPIYQHASGFPPPIAQELEGEGIKALAVIPLKYGGKVIGDVNLASHTHDEISEESKKAAWAVANLAGSAITRAQAEEELAKHRERLEELVEERSAALKQSEAKYRELFENATVGMFRSRLDGSAILGVNDKMAEIAGDTKENLLQSSAIIHWTDLQEREEMVRLLKEHGQVTDHEVHTLRKDGAVRTCLVSVIAYPDEGVLEGSVIDVTERRQVEEAQRQQWEGFLAMVSNFPETLYVTDPQTHEVLFVNRVFQDALGSDPVGKKCYRAFQGLDAPCDFCTDEIILRERVPYTWEYHNPMLNNDYLITDQIIRWPDGRDVRFEVAIDITERKQAERELLLKNIVFESSISANSIADNDGTITHVNPAFVELWGYESKEAAIGNSIASFFANPEDAGPILEALNETGKWKGEFLAKKQDGSTFITSSLATVVRDESGEQIGYQSAVIDVTVQREAEKELARRVAELESFNRLAVGREKRMIELKRRINQLSERLGEEPPYDISFTQ